MPNSEISSLDSSIPTNIIPDDQHNTENRQCTNTLNNNIITRTSTVLSYIKEDNKFAKTQVEPDPSYDPNDLARIGTAATSLNEQSPIAEDEISSESDNELESTKSKVLQDTGEYNIYDVENKPPDKGFWAWTAAVCVMCINTFSWGENAVFGVYLNYYTSTDYFPGASMEQYVMIGGLGLGLSFMSCTITNSLVRRYNYKIIMSIGTALIFLSYWLASIAKTVTQLIMFQGFLLSIGWALAAGSTFVILPTWFLKKRSIAQGIATAGGGLGGIIFSRPIDQMIKNYMDNPKYANDQHEALRLGMAWSLRMLSFVCGFMLVLSILLIRTYRPLKDPKACERPLLKDLFAFLFRLDLLKMVPMVCLILWNMVYGLTYTILLFSLSSYATAIGLTYQQGSNVSTIQSLAQTIGRPLTGMCSDKIGRVNTTIIFTFILTILVFLFWIFVTTYSQLMAFAFLAGFILGVNWVNFGPMTADVVGGGGADLNHAISLEMFTGGMPLLIAELVGFKLRRPEMDRPFLYCQILCGVASLVSALLLMPLREWKVKRILLARRKQFLYFLEHNGENENESNDNKDIIQPHNSENDKKNRLVDVGVDDDDSISHRQEEIKRLDRMLQNSIYAYFFRMFYPIAV